jgi:hypothetical protein
LEADFQASPSKKFMRPPFHPIAGHMPSYTTLEAEIQRTTVPDQSRQRKFARPNLSGALVILATAGSTK